MPPWLADRSGGAISGGAPSPPPLAKPRARSIEGSTLPPSVVRTPLLVAALLALPLAGCVGGATEDDLDSGVLAQGDDRVGSLAWPALADAIIRPGVMIRTPNGDCPTSFMFARPDNGTLFLATTAYCAEGLPVGTVATIADDMHLAVLAYNSWLTMAEIGETDPDALEYNDIAIFYIDGASRPDAHPSRLGTGGPVGLAEGSSMGVGDLLRIYRPGTTSDAVVTGEAGDWALLAHGLPPTLPGEMGGAVLTPEGQAVGVMVNLGVTTVPGANGIARLDRMMAYAAEHAKLDMVLVTAPLGDAE